MYKLTITFKNGKTNVFKTKRKTKNTSCIAMLAPHMLKGYRIGELEKYGRFYDSFKYYNCIEVIETRIDGRNKEYKNLPYFSFKYCFDNLI